MAIFNEEYIKKYNKNKEILEESALTIIGIGALAYVIFSFVVVASLLIGEKTDDAKFNELLNKYPQLKKLLQNMIDKTSDIFYKNCNNKLKVIELEKTQSYINKTTTKIDIKKNTSTYNYNICSAYLYDQMIKSNSLDYDSMSSFIYKDEYRSYIYFDENGKDFLEFKKENLEKADMLLKEYKNYAKDIKNDINTIKNVISSMNEELKNNPNGNIIKLSYWDGIDDYDRSKKELEEIANNDIIPMCIYVHIEIYINNIKKTDEVMRKVSELKAKYGKYYKN